MLHRRLADGALEQEHLIGQDHGIAMAKIDLHLRRALFVDQGVDLQGLGLGEGVDIFKQGVELIDRADGIGSAAGLGASRPADGRLKRIVGIDVALDQIEFELGGDDRDPALLVIQVNDALEHLTGGDLHRPAIVVDRVVDDLGGRVAGPGDGAEG